MELVQVCISVADAERSVRWYTDGLGFGLAGRMTVADMHEVSAFTGLADVAIEGRWVTGAQPFFQVELFRFDQPKPKPLPAGWRRSDVGFSTATYVVNNLDAVLRRLAALGTVALTAPLGPAGDRSVCVRDPDGALVELRERDPRPPSTTPTAGAPVACAVSASVSDLDAALRYFEGALGLRRADDIALHGPEHEAQWGLEGASSRVRLLWAGSLLIEVVEYLDPTPVRRPAGWRLCDRGFSHIALGTRSRLDCANVVDAVRRGGYGIGGTLDWPVVQATYVRDEHDLVVELLATSESNQPELGFPRLAPPPA